MATQKTKKHKPKTIVTWTDRTGTNRQGTVVNHVPAGTDFISKLTKQLTSLPIRRRKIEPITSFDRYIVAEEVQEGTRLFSLREEQLVVG